MKKLLLAGVAAVVLPSTAFAECPAVLASDANGMFPNQFELAEFQSLNSCELTFAGNPNAAELAARIEGMGEIPADAADRLPSEPLIIAPYEMIGTYGGTLNGLSNATEAGTSDLLSVRHVNLVRFSDDLATIVPNVAKAWSWNDDFTALTFELRAGHKWSDGDDFTAADVVFWYNNMVLDTNIIGTPKDRFLSAGEAMTVEALDDLTVRFTLNAPKPGLLAQFATDYAQPFQPSHLLSQFHPGANADADALAASVGMESGYDVVNLYYGQSDWKDVPQPILKNPAVAAALVEAGFTAVAPTLESHIVIEDTLEGRHLVANPYFFMVDTAGNQLPYINEIDEVYMPDEDVRVATMIAGDIDYKSQSVNLDVAPALLQNAEAGDYAVELRPTIGMPVVSFNLTAADEEKRAVFNDINFRQAMSHAINRDQINELAFFGLGAPTQYTAFDADTAPFVSEELRTAFTSFDAEGAAALLDAAGVVDADNDGDRDLPSGAEFTLQIQFSTQGVPTTVAEIVAQNFSDAGITTTIKEVTSDEYRAAQSANELDVHIWNKGEPLAVFLGDVSELTPPYSSYFGHRNGMLWAQEDSGVAAPATTVEMAELAAEFTTVEAGSDRSNELGAAIASKTVEDLFFIGTVKAQAPIYAHNNLKNFRTPNTWSYAYYRVFPYLPVQWSLGEGN